MSLLEPFKKQTDLPAEIGQIGEEFIPQVRAFGALGYTAERIANMLQITGRRRDVLLIRISSPGDTYHTAYFNGKAIGEYNIDAELAKHAEKGEIDSINLLQQRKDERDHLDLRRDLLGY